MIIIKNLQKSYIVPEREAGLKATIQGLFQRKTREVKAVDDISFTVEQGEIVGFLGPNGAGKTTTLKMLSGLLHPSSGEVTVNQFIPSKRDRAYLKQMTLVMGQRNQLVWDIPAIESFELNRALYQIPNDEYIKTRDEFIHLLDMQQLVNKPVRNLSLGERMKVEIAAALLHKPKLLFLDEPTIGLDITMQKRIREFIEIYNQKYQATVLLTSHYMADVEALCKRIIVIHQGKLLFDGALKSLVTDFSTHKTLSITLKDKFDGEVTQYGTLISRTETEIKLRISKEKIAQTTAEILQNIPVLDLSIEDPPIEDVIENVFLKEGDFENIN